MISFLIKFLLLSATIQGQSFISVKAPNNLQVTAGSVADTSMWITWEAVPKATSYSVSIKPPTIGVGGVGSGIMDTNSIITGLTPNTDYLITVRAIQGDFQGSPAVIAQTTALPAPTDVWAITNSVSQNSMTISWTTVEGAQSYTVEISPSSGIGGGGRGLYSTVARLRGLSPNTLYTITVFAVNWVGKGAEATLQQFTKLGPPKNLIAVSATVTPTSIGIQWSQVAGAESYEIKLSPSADTIPRIYDTRYVLRNLKPDTQYRILVAASNAAGPSSYSTVLQRTLSMCFADVDSFQEDNFKITCPPRCASHQSQVYGTREFSTDSLVCASAIHDGRINNNAGGRVTVKKRPGRMDFIGTTKNGIVSKDYENWHRSFVFALQSPHNVKAQPGSVFSDRMTIMWDAVSGAATYRVTVDPPAGVTGIDSNIEDTKVTLKGLRPNTTYDIYVSAVNRVETSDGTQLVQKTTLWAPKNLQIQKNSVHYDQFTVAWDAMSLTGTLRYQVTVYTDNRMVLQAQTDITSYTASNLTSGTLFNVSVQALNEVGLGRASWINQYTTLRRPFGLMTTDTTSTSITVTWGKVTGATSYSVDVNPGDNAVFVTEPFANFENLRSDTIYTISIKAINQFNESQAAMTQQRTKLPAPFVQMVPGTLTDKAVEVSWNSLRNASYIVSVFAADGSFPQANYTTRKNFFNFTNFQERTNYVVSVTAVNEEGSGEKDIIAFRTLIKPPPNLEIMTDGLRPRYIKLNWKQLPGIDQYYLSSDPSAGVRGTGIKTSTTAYLTGLQMDVPYTFRLMAVRQDEEGMNATALYTPVLPTPKIVAIHSLTEDSLTMQWDSKMFNVSAVSYNSSGADRGSISVSKSTNGKLEFSSLQPNQLYQFNLYSKHMSDFYNRHMQKPVVSQTVFTKTGMNMSEVVLFWPTASSPIITNYQVTMENSINQGMQNSTQSWLIMKRLKGEDTYKVCVEAENVARKLRSKTGCLQFSQRYSTTKTIDNVNGNDKKEDEIDYYDYYNNNDDVKKTNNPNDSGNDTETPTEDNNSVWIAAVVVLGCLLTVLLLILIPCLCHCRKKQPMLKNYGCCLCCYKSPTSKYHRSSK